MAGRELNLEAFDAIMDATPGQIAILSDGGTSAEGDATKSPQVPSVEESEGTSSKLPFRLVDEDKLDLDTEDHIPISERRAAEVVKKRKDVVAGGGQNKKKKTEDDPEAVVSDVEKGYKLLTSAANRCKKIGSDVSNLHKEVAKKTKLVEEKESLVSQLTLQISTLDLRVKELEEAETTLKTNKTKLKEDLRLEKERADKADEDLRKVPTEEEVIVKFLKSDRFKKLCDSKAAENFPIMYDQMRIYLKEDDGDFNDFKGWRKAKKQEEEKAKKTVEKPPTLE